MNKAVTRILVIGIGFIMLCVFFQRWAISTGAGWLLFLLTDLLLMAAAAILVGKMDERDVKSLIAYAAKQEDVIKNQGAILKKDNEIIKLLKESASDVQEINELKLRYIDRFAAKYMNDMANKSYPNSMINAMLDFYNELVKCLSAQAGSKK